MPKAILKFSLPEERNDFELASKGADWWLVVYDVVEFCRGEIKYNENLTEEAVGIYEKLLNQIHESKQERGLVDPD